MVNVVLAVAAVAIAAVYALGIAAIPTMMISDAVGPRAYPTLLLILLLIVSVMLVLEGWGTRDWTAGRQKVMEFIRLDSGTFLCSSLAILAYFLLFEPLGYLLSTALFLLCGMLLLHHGRRWVAIVVALGFTVATYILFAEVFGTQLPTGLLAF
ncbi:tripartite tricarboxylate transporter TctB family protein [Pelagibacterium nitratireducens]|uniref:Tripartite tricarboxylate transporter TctB family protein n=1 Tax=Pelagibacterium nitratireducens TaxID=1046114 RepID=A0ABZ2I069_9HYPH